MNIKSFIDQLKDDNLNLEGVIYQLLEISIISEFRNDPYSQVLIVAPPYNWGKLSPDGEVIQTNAILLLDELISKLDLLFDSKPSTILHRYEKLKTYFNGVIKRGKTDWSVPSSIDKAKKDLKEKIEETDTILDWMKNLGNRDLVFVPDTNALIINHRLESYGKTIGDIEKWTVVITPTVLKELDELKIRNTGNEFKEKIKKTINYLKGLRVQGDPLNGVRIFDNHVIFKLQAIEPNMNRTLPWLDANNNDDRIIASCFDIQIKNPASCVILMTADINLQTKAQMARLPFVEPESD